jgi:hypothetical protein
VSPSTVAARAADATEALVEAIENLPYDDRKRPSSPNLRSAWPDLGRAWIAQWARELGRDLHTVATDLEQAAAATTGDEALTPLENAFWRLGGARDKFYAVIALAYGIPSLEIGDDKNQTLSFKPDHDACKQRLSELQPDHPPAARILNFDGKLADSLLLRHQATHSLAPIVKSPSLTWAEAAIIEGGGVKYYEAFHVPPKGLDQLDDIGEEALRERAQHLAEKGLDALVNATVELAALLDAAGELEPPPIIWKAMEINQCFYSRDEASARSKAASQEAVRPG